MIDHPTFVIYVDELPHLGENDKLGYVVGSEQAKLVNRVVRKGHQVYITTQPFKFPPIYSSYLLFTGDRVLCPDEYNGEHVFMMQYYQGNYTMEELTFIKYMFDDIYEIGIKENAFDGTHLIKKGMCEPTPKLRPVFSSQSTNT